MEQGLSNGENSTGCDCDRHQGSGSCDQEYGGSESEIQGSQAAIQADRADHSTQCLTTFPERGGTDLAVAEKEKETDQVLPRAASQVRARILGQWQIPSQAKDGCRNNCQPQSDDIIPGNQNSIGCFQSSEIRRPIPCGIQRDSESQGAYSDSESSIWPSAIISSCGQGQGAQLQGESTCSAILISRQKNSDIAEGAHGELYPNG